MTDLSTEVRVAECTQANSQNSESALPASHVVCLALVVGAAFVLYWGSSFILDARKATTHFGADSWYYAELAGGDIIRRVASNYYLDRVARFHPTTVFMAAAWMQVFSPLTQWIAPLYLLKAMFAATGAVGVWAASSAFAAVVPRGYALLFGIVYAVSLGVWYFASIEESKIVTASLSALYIAIYLHVRKTWTVRGVVFLTGILLVACLNEMISGFLVIIPVVDIFMRYGWDWRQGRWIALHALAGPLAFAIIEGVIFGRLVGVSHPEGTSHFGMLIFYISKNYYSLENIYSFVINWLFFNVAAPSRDAAYAVPAWANYKGYFEPSLINYFTSPTSVAVAVLFCAVVVASALPRYRAERTGTMAGIIWALAAYVLLRGLFFIVFNPYEPLLFSPAVTLALLLMVAIPFAASKVPAKQALLGVFAALLFIANGAFIIGR